MANISRKCYFPSGVIAETNVPCSGEEYTSCCHYTDICLSNGLCLSAGQQPYTLSRGSCTNQRWDQGCPEYCGLSSTPRHRYFLTSNSYQPMSIQMEAAQSSTLASGIASRGTAAEPPQQMVQNLLVETATTLPFLLAMFWPATLCSRTSLRST
jgi:hypothetical protein